MKKPGAGLSANGLVLHPKAAAHLKSMGVHVDGAILSKPIPVDGACCACGNDQPEETPCLKREDHTHCVHWWEGDS